MACRHFENHLTGNVEKFVLSYKLPRLRKPLWIRQYCPMFARPFVQTNRLNFKYENAVMKTSAKLYLPEK